MHSGLAPHASQPDAAGPTSTHVAQCETAEAREGDDEYASGCPKLLRPITQDWSPTTRDLRAPQVLPSRTFVGRFTVMRSSTATRPLQSDPLSLARPAPPNGQTSGVVVSGDERLVSPTYQSFEPFYLPCRSRRHLADGIEPRYPASIMVDHNVSTTDWDSFLVNVRVAGALQARHHLLANLLPAPLIVLHAGWGNYWITKLSCGNSRISDCL